jgi:micrococcal nuclease
MKHSWAALLGIGLVGGYVFNTVNSSAETLEPATEPAIIETKCVAIDGDTLRCGTLRVRLSGVDAAELPGHCRQDRDCAPGDPLKHRRALADFVRYPVFVIPLKIDKYGRTVALVKDGNSRNASCAAIAAGARYVLRWDEGLHVAAACIKQIRFKKSAHKEI